MPASDVQPPQHHHHLLIKALQDDHEYCTLALLVEYGYLRCQGTIGGQSREKPPTVPMTRCLYNRLPKTG
eukprot:1951758-Amphidinium_carterae.1